MKIYSWNMLYRNKELEQAFEFIAHTDFDIFCLQEVPEEFLKRLQTLSFHIAYRNDMEKIFSPSRTVSMFNVILSKHPVAAQGEILFADYWELLPWRTRFFVHFMPAQLFSRIRNRGSLYADVTMSGEEVRVFCLHLILAQPLWRLKEFELAMTKRDPSRSTIVCGDFNILERPHITLLNWILGGKVSDVVLYNRERTHIERRFIEYKLLNHLSGKSTHSLSR